MERRRADAAESLLRSERKGGGEMASHLSSSSSPTVTGDATLRAEGVPEKEEGKEENVEEGHCEEDHHEEGRAREGEERQGRQREEAKTSAAISTALLWLQSSMEAKQRQIEEITECLASG